MIKTVVAIGLCVLALSSAASAQSVPSELRVLVEKPDEDGVACGITESGIVAAARAAMRYNRVAESTDWNAPTLYVSVTSLGRPSCATMVNFQIFTFGFEDNLPGVGPISSNREFCGKGELLMGSSMGQRVSDSVKGLVDRCLSEISEKAAKRL